MELLEEKLNRLVREISCLTVPEGKMLIVKLMELMGDENEPTLDSNQNSA